MRSADEVCRLGFALQTLPASTTFLLPVKPRVRFAPYSHSSTTPLFLYRIAVAGLDSPSSGSLHRPSPCLPLTLWCHKWYVVTSWIQFGIMSWITDLSHICRLFGWVLKFILNMLINNSKQTNVWLWRIRFGFPHLWYNYTIEAQEVCNGLIVSHLHIWYTHTYILEIMYPTACGTTCYMWLLFLL